MVEWLAFRILEAPGSNLGPETVFQALVVLYNFYSQMVG